MSERDRMHIPERVKRKQADIALADAEKELHERQRKMREEQKNALLDRARMNLPVRGGESPMLGELMQGDVIAPIMIPPALSLYSFFYFTQWSL